MTKEEENEVIEIINKEKDNQYPSFFLHNYNLGEEFIRKLFTLFPEVEGLYREIAVTQELNEELIREFKDKFEWYIICEYQDLSCDFLIEMKDYIDWEAIVKWQRLNDNFVDQFFYKLDQEELIEHHKLSEKIIHKYAKEIDWNKLLLYHHLSERFLINHFEYYSNSNVNISNLLVRGFSPSFEKMLEQQKARNLEAFFDCDI